jgi:hypothetical protein
MILPTKHLAADRALLTLGARLLAALDEPRTVSSLWDRLRLHREVRSGRFPLSYDWFVLSLDLLFMLGAISYRDGLVVRSSTP